jgi:hypothetical protein
MSIVPVLIAMNAAPFHRDDDEDDDKMSDTSNAIDSAMRGLGYRKITHSYGGYDVRVCVTKKNFFKHLIYWCSALLLLPGSFVYIYCVFPALTVWVILATVGMVLGLFGSMFLFPWSTLAYKFSDTKDFKEEEIIPDDYKQLATRWVHYHATYDWEKP